jgi:hypothetical protein
VPEPFIAHVLRTPPQSLWVPSAEELRRAGVVTGPAPDTLLAGLQDDPSDLHGLSGLLAVAPDAALESFVRALSAVIAELGARDATLCWRIFRQGGVDSRSLPLTPSLAALDSVSRATVQQARASPVAPLGAEPRRAAVAALAATLRLNHQEAVLAVVRSGDPQAAFCPAMHTALETALGLPNATRAATLRALMPGG